MADNYIHLNIPEISTDFLREGDVVVRSHKNRTPTEIMSAAVLTMKLAKMIGIQAPVARNEEFLPYSDSNDNLVFSCPLNSALFGRNIHFLRGWKQFESCIKGSNALGL